jgi:transcriptional regulator GlxA family with amidase domain
MEGKIMLDTEAALGSSGFAEKLADAAAAVTNGDRDRARNALENALALLSGTPRFTADSRPVLLRGGLAPWQARRVAAYVQDNIGSSLRASELSRLVRLSYSHFNRAFKVSFRQTPTSYIMNQRVKLAQEKMLTTAHPLSQVALECGLCDQAHFSRMFRRIVGQSPRLWRTQFVSGSSAPRDPQSSH